MIATRSEIRRAAGHLITCGFAGKTLSSELKEILREVEPVGVILFARNIESAEAVAELNKELKEFRKKDPLLISVDQEGGRVARIKQPATVWPPMRRLGEIGDLQLCEQVGAALARELRAMNFDVDYAPVLDVDTNPKNPIIGDRAFSDSPKVVAAMGAAMIRGLQNAGVGACGKHFPGHGDTDVDSHLALPFVGHELGRLREVEWPPFRAAIDAGLGAIMTAHVVMQCIDEHLPATLSSAALSYLRRELKFKGVIISDDLEMKAVANHFSVADMAEKGLQAGIDMFLACEKPEVVLELYRSIILAVEQEKISHETLLKAEKRVLAWRDRYYQAPVAAKECREVLGCLEHQKLIERMA